MASPPAPWCQSGLLSAPLRCPELGASGCIPAHVEPAFQWPWLSWEFSGAQTLTAEAPEPQKWGVESDQCAPGNYSEMPGGFREIPEEVPGLPKVKKLLH